jgi:hypothetical protein
MAFLLQNTAEFCKKAVHNIIFLRKTAFFGRKLVKIAENCDHNIDPPDESWNKLRI